ncbi:MAG: bifunctional hydroxymethylpyrimidine kinase/phosphomethylpyrimidine kinase [Acidobacteria bacterium]|nr:bifunctional hydroxymethylpyrimidine kinase/phosphomethylpyrimidine kinase [Acidobacteriota bacterium]
MLDHFIWGSVSRISPEAPVPVVLVKRESFHLGGAGNVTANLAALGAAPVPVGAIGADDAGRRTMEALAALGAPRDGIVEVPSRTTTKKTRVVAHAQQVVMFDREEDAPLPAEAGERLLAFSRAAIRGAKALIVSDYEKGTVTESLLAALLPEARRLGVPAIVDPKPAHFSAYRPITAITPNASEASQMSGIAIRDDSSAERAARKILETLEGPAVLLTRGESGMLLAERGAASVTIPAAAREVYDVTGAGDTVASVFALTMAAGGTALESAAIANVAASIVVGKVGTATASVEEILGVIQGAI